MNTEDLIKKAAQIRAESLTAIYKAQSGYAGSSMSVVDILTALYYGEISGKPVVSVDVRKPDWIDQDYVILSKGHASIVQYAILADLGFFAKEELDHFRQIGSLLQAHPSLKVPGITASIPAHGYGLSIACGLAMGIKMERNFNRVYAVLGDGELQEGQVWEAAMAAAHYKLDNLVAIVDNDGGQMDGPVRSIMDVNPIQAKFEAFGWKVFQVLDGHDFDQILSAVSRAYTVTRQPICIWCHTVKGKGISFAEGKDSYHAASLSEAELNEVLPKLKAIYEQS